MNLNCNRIEIKHQEHRSWEYSNACVLTPPLDWPLSEIANRSSGVWRSGCSAQHKQHLRRGSANCFQKLLVTHAVSTQPIHFQDNVSYLNIMTPLTLWNNILCNILPDLAVSISYYRIQIWVVSTGSVKTSENYAIDFCMLRRIGPRISSILI